MIIDNINIKEQYGAIVSENSLKSVVNYPTLNEPPKNDWAEHFGIEVDLSTPTLKKRNVVLEMICDFNKFTDFINFLSAKTYRIYNFLEISYAFKFRFSEVSDYKVYHSICSFKLTLIDDIPLYNYTPQTPLLSANDESITLDGVNLKQYGVSVLDGTLQSLEGYRKAKSKLEIRNSLMSGVEVQEAALTFKEYIATINCYMKQSVNDFWVGYYKLLYDFIQPNERDLVANGNSYSVYYKSSTVKNFFLVGSVVYCEFSIKVVVI